ncbi:MAG: 50S ribosomal protein L23 [Bdellovibrio sp. CG10_big_fil_rev_8_21_14_0_10_47_8]|nr:MAG: 50S ribosomal protein L23 [Bdellovibrio sp. CG10_big_fil_rev_8_21_14_0_10_47_8]
MKHVIKRPLVTEKNTYHNAVGVYVFEVDLTSDKAEVKSAVEKNFKVKVQSVRTSICRGHAKVTKFGRGKVPHWKKAYVKLAAGEKIALFEGV